MIHLLFILLFSLASPNPVLSSSCNIVNQTQFCTSTTTITTSNCSAVAAWPPYQCTQVTLASISTNSSQIAQPPPAWVSSISDQINQINALGWAPNGWMEFIGISKLISIPGYFAIKGAKKLPRFTRSMWMSHTFIGGLVVIVGLIGFFGFLSLTFFSVCLGGTWILSYPYLGKVQRSSSE